MSGKISNEQTHLLLRRYPNYGPQPPEPTLPELIQRCKERLEKLELNAFMTASQESFDKLRECELTIKRLEMRVEKGYEVLPGPGLLEDLPSSFDPDNPYYQLPHLHTPECGPLHPDRTSEAFASSNKGV